MDAGGDAGGEDAETRARRSKTKKRKAVENRRDCCFCLTSDTRVEDNRLLREQESGRRPDKGGTGDEGQGAADRVGEETDRQSLFTLDLSLTDWQCLLLAVRLLQFTKKPQGCVSRPLASDCGAYCGTRSPATMLRVGCTAAAHLACSVTVTKCALAPCCRSIADLQTGALNTRPDTFEVGMQAVRSNDGVCGHPSARIRSTEAARFQPLSTWMHLRARAVT